MIAGLNASLLMTSSGTARDATTPRKVPSTMPTKAPKERAFLVGVEINRQGGLLSVDESLNELSLLADTAGLDVVGSATQRLDHPDPKTYIRSGKVLEKSTVPKAP